MLIYSLLFIMALHSGRGKLLNSRKGTVDAEHLILHSRSIYAAQTPNNHAVSHPCAFTPSEIPLKRFVDVLFMRFPRRVPPAVYKKAKDADAEDRQDVLIRGLKDLLKKEGLSGHPSDQGTPCCNPSWSVETFLSRWAACSC